MDHGNFDRMARRFGTASTRRQALRIGIASGLGLGLAKVGAEAVKAGGKKHVTDRCDSSSQCGSGLTCKKANSQNSCFQKSEKRCCKPVGAKCNDGCECCGVDVICNGGYCDKA